MPRLIDYGVRFDLAREAAFAITLRDEAAAVNMQTVSRELGVSVATVRRFVAGAWALSHLGLDLVERSRRVRRLTGGGVGLLGDPPLKSLVTGEISAETAEEVIDHHLSALAAHPADGVA